MSLPSTLGSDDDAGWIEFGRTPFFYGDGDQGAIVPIQPTAGRLLLFPSFFYHRTIPFQASDIRLTIAFDLRPS